MRNSSGVSQSSSPEPLGILEALPIWLNTEAGRILADVTVDCISTLRQQVLKTFMLECSVLNATTLGSCNRAGPITRPPLSDSLSGLTHCRAGQYPSMITKNQKWPDNENSLITRPWFVYLDSLFYYLLFFYEPI